MSNINPDFARPGLPHDHPSPGVTHSSTSDLGSVVIQVITTAIGLVGTQALTVEPDASATPSLSTNTAPSASNDRQTPSSRPTSNGGSTQSSGSTPSGSSTPSVSSTISGSLTPGGSSTQSGSSSASQSKAFVGGVTGTVVIIILGLVVFCVMRRKRRNKTSRSASHENPTSCDVLGEYRPQSIRISPIPRPFLDFSMVENSLPSKELFLYRKRDSLLQNNQRDVEEAVDPFNDPVHVSTNDDEGQRVGDRLNHFETFTNQFEEELRQLGALAQSGQLSTEDRLRLEEITRNIGSMVPCNSGRDRSSLATNPSSGSSLSPPSYHTHGS